MIKSFTPAIPNYNESVRKIAKKQPLYFRTKKFNLLLKKCQELLKYHLHCKSGEVVILTASGTGAMDASIQNLIDKKDKILIIVGGSFGERWTQMCEHYKLHYDIFETEFGKNINLEELKTVIEINKPTHILIQHNETSSMQLYPIKEIGILCKKYKIRFIVDAISSFCIDYIDMDNWNIDCVIISTNKGVGTYSGLSAIIFKSILKRNLSVSYYFNFDKYIKDFEDVSLPFTPNLTSIYQLYYQLNKFKKIGLKNIINKIHKRAIHFRTMIIKFNLPFKIIAQTSSNCGTALYTNRTDVKYLFEKLQKKNIFFTPSGGKQGKKFIIGHIGEQSIKDNFIIIKELQKWLRKK